MESIVSIVIIAIFVGGVYFYASKKRKNNANNGSGGSGGSTGGDTGKDNPEYEQPK